MLWSCTEVAESERSEGLVGAVAYEAIVLGSFPQCRGQGVWCSEAAVRGGRLRIVTRLWTLVVWASGGSRPLSVVQLPKMRTGKPTFATRGKMNRCNATAHAGPFPFLNPSSPAVPEHWRS